MCDSSYEKDKTSAVGQSTCRSSYVCAFCLRGGVYEYCETARGAGIGDFSITDEMTDTLYLKVGEHVLTATLVDNSSARALKELLAEGI